MMKIKDILSIQLDNDIKNVIDLNSQSEDEIKEELDGFILTESLAGHLSDLLSQSTKWCFSTLPRSITSMALPIWR